MRSKTVMDNRYLFEMFEERKAEGMELYRSGQFGAARQKLLEAAEFLYKLAGRSEGELKSSRLKNAEKLIEMAKKIKDMPDQKPGQVHADAGGGDTEDGDAEAWRLAERPGVRFADIAGLDDVKDAISVRMILPIQHPEKAARFGVRPGGGLLLYGPPGTGKTMLARAVAGEIDAPFFTVSPADILSRWVGDAEKNIDKLFRTARKHPLAVIFIDEIEAMLPRRDVVESPVMQRLVPQVLAELEGVDKESHNPLMFIGATNKPWSLDEAVLRPGRFDEQIYVPLPDPAARRQILFAQFAKHPLAEDVDFERLVEITENFSGADIVGLAQRVRGDVFRRAIREIDEQFIGAADIEAILTRTKPSVTREMLSRYDQFRARDNY